jgi:hypothetical protein
MKRHKVLAVGAIVVGLLAAPTVWVAAQSEGAATQSPAAFTGRITCGPEVRAGTRETVTLPDGQTTVSQYRGAAWRQSATMTDPRLEGTHYQSWESDTYLPAGADTQPAVSWGTQRIENEDGAWQGSWVEFSADGSGASLWTAVLDGEGGYEGLTAIWEATMLADGTCGADVEGMVFAGTVHTAPPFTVE